MSRRRCEQLSILNRPSDVFAVAFNTLNRKAPVTFPGHLTAPVRTIGLAEVWKIIGDFDGAPVAAADAANHSNLRKAHAIEPAC